MNTPHYQLAAVRKWAIGLAATSVLSSVFVFAPPTSAGVVALDRAPDGLSIAITDGTTDTVSGASLNYTVTVTNRGATPVAGELVITLPAFATFSHTDGAHGEKTDAVWTVSVAPGTSERRRATAAIGRIPAQEVRVTTLATLYTSADRSQILVRAADANAIEGVLDPAHTVGHGTRTVSKAQTDPTLLVLGVSVLAVLLALGLIRLVTTRRRSDSGAAQHRGARHDRDS